MGPNHSLNRTAAKAPPFHSGPLVTRRNGPVSSNVSPQYISRMKYYRPAHELTGKRLSASTLAAFVVCQSAEQADSIRAHIPMPTKLLRFLLRDQAMQYWSKNGWLRANGSGEHIVLTSDGLQKVQDRLHGLARAQSVTSAQVHEELEVIRGRVRLEPLDEVESEGLAPSLALSGSQNLNQSDGPPAVDERTLAEIWTRRGQPEFRERLLLAYGSRCAVTQCDAEDALEAAHITPHAEERNYDLCNGMLLRADVHTLFDLFLLAVDPASWTVHVSPKVMSSYGDLEGVQASIPSSESARPDVERLRQHYRACQTLWSAKSG